MPDHRAPIAGRVRKRGWTRVSYGIHLPEDGDPLVGWHLALPPSGAFTHLTAAAHYGLWLPPLPEDLPVFATVAASETRPRRPGLHVTRHQQAPAIREEGNLRWVEPAEAILACCRHLALLDRLVLIDAALQRKICTQSELEDKAAARRAGAPAMREALRHADGRSESAWETRLRMLHLVCGVPVEPQHEIFTETGLFVARGDLWIRGSTALHEYDGAEHRHRKRHANDLRRERRITNTEWIRRGYTSSDVLHQAVGILRDADLSLGRRHDPSRIRRWHALLAESLFTPSGTAAFRHRIGLPTSPREEWSLTTA